MQDQPTGKTKRHFCSFCNKAFSRSEHKTRHERSHAGVKPFECQVCSHSFVRRDLLQRHIRTVHRILLLRDTGAPSQENEKDATFNVNNVDKLINSMIIVNNTVNVGNSTLDSNDTDSSNAQIGATGDHVDQTDDNNGKVTHYTFQPENGKLPQGQATDGQKVRSNSVASENRQSQRVSNGYNVKNRVKSKFLSFKQKDLTFGEHGDEAGIISIDYTNNLVLSNFSESDISMIIESVESNPNLELLLLIIHIMERKYPHAETSKRILTRVLSFTGITFIESKLIAAIQVRYSLLSQRDENLLKFYSLYQDQILEFNDFSVFNLNQWTCLSDFLNASKNQNALVIYQQFKRKFLLDKKSILMPYEILNLLDIESKKKLRNLNNLDYFTNLTYWESVLLNDNNFDLLIQLNKNYMTVFENGQQSNLYCLTSFNSKPDGKHCYNYRILSESNWLLLKLLCWNKDVNLQDSLNSVKHDICNALIPLMNTLIDSRERLFSIKNDNSKISLIIDALFFQLELFSVQLLPKTQENMEGISEFLCNESLQKLIYFWYMTITKTFGKFKTNDKRLKLIKQFINSYIKSNTLISGNKKRKLNSGSGTDSPSHEENLKRLEDDLSVILYDMWSNEYQGYHFLIDTVVKCIKDDLIEARVLQILDNDCEDVKVKLIDAALRAINNIEFAIKSSESQYVSTLKHRRGSTSKSIALPISHDKPSPSLSLQRAMDQSTTYIDKSRLSTGSTQNSNHLSTNSTPTRESFDWSGNSSSMYLTSPRVENLPRVRNSISGGMIGNGGRGFRSSNSKIVLPPINLSAIHNPSGSPTTSRGSNSTIDGGHSSYVYGNVLMSPQSSVDHNTLPNSTTNHNHNNQNTRLASMPESRPAGWGSDPTKDASGTSSTRIGIDVGTTAPNNFTYGILSGYSMGESVNMQSNAASSHVRNKNNESALEPKDKSQVHLQTPKSLDNLLKDGSYDRSRKNSLMDGNAVLSPNYQGKSAQSNDEVQKDRKIRLPPPSEILNTAST